MQSEELQAQHDEIWREIYERQKRILKLSVPSMPYVQDSGKASLNCASQIDAESKKPEAD